MVAVSVYVLFALVTEVRPTVAGRWRDDDWRFWFLQLIHQGLIEGFIGQFTIMDEEGLMGTTSADFVLRGGAASGTLMFDKRARRLLPGAMRATQMAALSALRKALVAAFGTATNR